MPGILRAVARLFAHDFLLPQVRLRREGIIPHVGPNVPDKAARGCPQRDTTAPTEGTSWRDAPASGSSSGRPHNDRQRCGGALAPITASPGVAQSCRTMLRRELLIVRPPLYSMSPSFLNLFMKKFTLARVVPIISASVSWEIFGSFR